MRRSELPRFGRGLAITLAAALMSAGCGGVELTVEESGETGTLLTADDAGASDGSIEETATPVAPAGIDAGFDADLLFDTLTVVYADADGLWPGFFPNAYPTILAINDDGGELSGLIALNYPDPESIGDATEFDLAEGIDSAHAITNLNDKAIEAVAPVTSMDFEADVDGTTTFVVLIDPPGSGGLFDPENPSEFAATLLHEMFHIYQSEQFEPSEAEQDTGGYAYTTENIELAVLEDRALVASLQADSPEEREAAARHVGAIRLVRLDDDERVVLDEDQEIVEGSARDYESRIAGTDPSFTYREDNYVDNLTTDPTSILGPLKWHFGFSRFYGSGAGQLQLLRLLGVSGLENRVQAGESPMDILIETLDLKLEEAPALVEDARGFYDPTGELAAQAEEVADRAADEPDPLSEEALDSISSGGSLEEQLRATFGDEAYLCLEEAGVDFDAEAPPSDEILSECGVDLSELDAAGDTPSDE